MKVTLLAKSHPQLGDIVIKDSLFSIGRQEYPFNTQSGDAIAKLSRRHARIFEQDEAVYIIDVGSMNGTSLNGQALGKKAAKLHHGDEICFAGQLQYQVNLSQEEKAQTHPLPQTLSQPLSLIPAHQHEGLDNLIVTRFPFLISKTDGAFAQYKDSFPDELKHLSRRHAHIFIKQDTPYIEDLDSTNGTFVNDKRLDEHAVPLHDGDTLAFGGSFFRYQVSMQSSPDIKAVSSDRPEHAEPALPQESITEEPKTTFITSASPFLDIFCQPETTEDEAQEAQPGAAKQQADSTSQPMPGRLKKARLFLSELKQALGLDEGKGRLIQYGWWFGAGLLLVLAVSLLLYQRGATEREVKSLLAQGEYAASAQMAAQYLLQHPQDDSMAALANEALLKATVPTWLEALERNDFASARAQIQEAKALTPAYGEGQQLMDLLTWVTAQQQFFTQRPSDSSLILFKHEATIESLLQQWNRNPHEYRRLLDLIRQQVPSFKSQHTRTFSQLRQLRNERSIYLSAVEGLKQDIHTALATNQASKLTQVLANFAGQYPNISGIDRLQADLDRYLSLQSAIAKSDLDTLSRLYDKLAFQTPPFQETARRQLSQVLPPSNLLQAHQAADQAWRSGQAEQAIALLQPMTSHPTWGEAIRLQLQHYRHVLEEFDALQANRSAPEYGTRLITFYSSLDPEQDIAFLQQLEDDIQHYAKQALKQADEKLQTAQQYWQQYRNSGGITSTLRLEGDISDRFRERARTLLQAQAQASQGLRFYKLLQRQVPPAWQALHERIHAELRGQRQWLRDLSTVLEPPLLQAKLQLLATSEEARP